MFVLTIHIIILSVEHIGYFVQHYITSLVFKLERKLIVNETCIHKYFI